LLQKVKGIGCNQRGFTLVELLVILTILALLVGLVVPKLSGLIPVAISIPPCSTRRFPGK
jgi:prepilin-type N-terminal cleavage/methylation domain-containing protein